MKSCCDAAQKPPAHAVRGQWRIALLGQPNCGKTTLFNRLTGSHQTTGNWPGVTVERKEGTFTLGDRKARLIDLPGVYSLIDDSKSGKDERIARDFLTCQPLDLVVNVVDAAALERQLFLTVQLLHMGLPAVVALNRIDLLKSANLEIDAEKLANLLGCPVVPISAYRNEGIDAFKDAMQTQLDKPTALQLDLPEPLRQVVEELRTAAGDTRPTCWQALRWLLAPEEAPDTLRQMVEHARRQVESALTEDINLIIADLYFSKAHEIAQQVVRRTDRLSRSATETLDHRALHPVLGLPIFLGVMYLVFALSVNLGNAFVDAFDLTAQALFVDGPRHLMESWGAPQWLIALLADGLGGGLQVVVSFIPVIAFLFLFLSLLEESGYMQRAALITDRAFQKLGLSGQAFVPLVVGFGCNVPAVMASRTLPSLRDRIITILMTPFMSCSARLTVYVLFAAVFFREHAALLVFLLYLIGIGAAVLTAWLLKQTVLPGERKPLLLELPRYHWPSPLNLLINVRNKLRGFILDAGKVIVIVVLMLNFFNDLGTDGTFGHANKPDSVLSTVGKTITPLVEPLGVNEENWPATVGLFTGLLAKEVVVGTLDALYTQMDGHAAPDEKGRYDLWQTIKAAWATVPAYFAEFGHALLDPIGLGGVMEASAQEAGASDATAQKIAELFGSTAAAFAYLLLILLYFPCVATFAAIRQELGWRWAIFSGGWSIFLGYSAAVGFYQVATFTEHPAQSALWLLGIAAAWALAWWWLRRAGRDPKHNPFLNTA
ncbi:ferrous iron transport protein B [Sulfurivirga caldicuralii]|uniref:Ferrous iron transport protein B n=1 Tax=Sulfurivirga caldicuralii TaxID=364032 RepID=A0A1N6GLP7_9GAMM|nr:Fe(2+) transporter permease subunit FeoB [Sulfurivirga caldicuralii]SIO08444.1 ferrous iron transport protein B [Sulfurivirga caldicuralii]